ncbi:superoxide dismutase family protein [Streptomyces lincolnensis]|uniref:superoxide dismutase family protein n=1 Tax=Streptomyces lincolnensis TaxID=1915 RepID=UPI001E52475D|nr:superoxide dismutase family protein [Streptomyces lincolnensis]MCD7439562.1 superoxide dismutase family protein [Streptomyces lincolnensis]
MLAGISMGAAAVAAAVLAGGGAHDPHDPPDSHGYRMRTDARFAPPEAFVPSAAVTYDRELVPAGAWIEVAQRTGLGGATTVGLRTKGLRPGHSYGVHVHQKPCAADPAAAGGHYQHEPSADPHHVTAENEVWLDFTADGHGSGTARAHHSWGFRRGEASSVVLHDEPGSKGARVACFTVPFGWVAGTA